MKNKLFLLLLSLLGFSGCEKESPDAYGTPYTDYKINGRVTDRAGSPIPNILVKRYRQDTGIRTDAEGAYLLTGQDHWLVDSLFFTDTDGPDNGGAFAEKRIAAGMDKAIKSKDGHGWYGGEYERTIDVSLEETPSGGK